MKDFIADGFATNNSRPFWKYMKSQRQDSFGIPPLQRDGILHTNSKDKAEIMLDEFKSVFTQEDTSCIPQMLGPAYPPISNLIIYEEGVEKLLSQLDPNKASGPDGIPCKVLKELSVELSPLITGLLRQTLETGTVPKDWTDATISPIFKKGNVHLAANYRPVSLTCIISKVMEHILCKHILNHLDLHHILRSCQHGFRKGHSCESQLLLTIDDFMCSFDQSIQVDVGILDFSRAFDTVPHERLLKKLEHYGIIGAAHTWIRSFLHDRQMKVVVDGESSNMTQVCSGVPQGTVLGPLLFLLFINDLPDQVSPGTTIRLFADDCLIYRQIKSAHDQNLLQKDLMALNEWAEAWGMKFNPKKCNILRISRSRSPYTQIYLMGNEILQEKHDAKYLGITISDKLDWSSHVSVLAKKASNTLSFVRRNLKYCPKESKQLAYFSLVRSTMDYCAAVWDPHMKKDQDNLERVNRRAARFVTNDYSSSSSVTSMLEALAWPTLANRRENQRLVMMYKIVHALSAVPSTNLLPADERTRSNHQNKFREIRASSTIYQNSFFPRTIPTWNNLPSELVDSVSLDTFKNRLLI